MLDRYDGWLGYSKVVGDVMAESRSGKADRALKRAYREVYERGKYSMFGADFHNAVLTSKKIKVKPKEANIPGLQLSDMLAHPVKQAWLAERGVVSQVGQFGARLAQVSHVKFNMNEQTGQIAGYGRVWLPRK
jgi:hypothetical protein